MTVRPIVLLLLLGLSSSVWPGSHQAPAGGDLLREDFEATATAQLPGGWRPLGGKWGVARGELVGENLDGEARILIPGGPWEDFQVEVTVRFLAVKEPSRWLAVNFGARSGAAGAGARPAPGVAVRPVLYHNFTVRQDATRGNGVEYAARYADRAWSVREAGSHSERFELGRGHRLRLWVSGGRVRSWVDGRLVVDSSLARDVEAGGIGFQLSSARAAFDDLTISGLPAEEVASMRVEYGPLRRIPIIAHRGASAAAPENTLAALRLGIARGAQGAEFDVYRTRDGSIVLMHDKDVVRTTNFRDVFPDRRDARVAALTLEEIRKLDAGSWKGTRYRGEPVPTLTEALEVLGDRVIPVVEIKPGEIGKDVARVIRGLGLADRVFVQSFSARAIREYREELPQTTTGYITGDRVSVDELERARAHLRTGREAGANAVVCHFSLVGTRYLEEMRRRAMTVWVYTVDDPALWDMLVRLGVDGLITNVPGAAVKSVAPKR